ncbi:MAG: 2Fe-2S iron-sulfur cluster-binding protein, partial [Cardiobacterium sp.]
MSDAANMIDVTIDDVQVSVPKGTLVIRAAEQAGIGCSVCYETFHHELQPLLRRIHGSSVH